MKIILRDGTRPRPYMVLFWRFFYGSINNNELSNLASGRNVTTRIVKAKGMDYNGDLLIEWNFIKVMDDLLLNKIRGI